MSTYTQIIYQIVFSTKRREPTLSRKNRPELFKYIYGVLKNNKCHLYRLNGVDDHLHIVTHLHPTVALASLIKDIKLSSSGYIKEKGLFPRFNAWQEGYGAFTYSYSSKKNLIRYVMKQEAHHQKKTYKSELINLLHEHGVEYDDKYLL